MVAAVHQLPIQYAKRRGIAPDVVRFISHMVNVEYFDSEIERQRYLQAKVFAGDLSEDEGDLIAHTFKFKMEWVA